MKGRLGALFDRSASGDDGTGVRALRLAGYELCDFWEEGSDLEPADPEFGASPAVRWFATYDVDLMDDRGDAAGDEGWAGVESFKLHYPVCSPAMKGDPPADLAEEMRIALVQDRFDEARAFEHLREQLAILGYLPVPDLIGRLRELLYFLPKA